MITMKEEMEILEEIGGYYNEFEELYHVIFAEAISNEGHYFGYYEEDGTMEGSFELSYNFATKNKEIILNHLEIEPNDHIEIYAYDTNKWKIHNYRNGRSLFIKLSTRIGADDGHLDFINGWAMAFANIPNVHFSIPFIFETLGEAIERFEWRINNDLL